MTDKNNWDEDVLGERDESKIVDCDSLFYTELNIKEKLKQCGYWGELDLSRNDYQVLVDLIKKRGESQFSKNKKMKFLFNDYPLSMVTSMIFFLIFEYDSDNFWSEWADRVGLELNQQHTGDIGKKVMSIFEAQKMTKYDDDGYRYLTPLLCQAGIPDHDLSYLFYIIWVSDAFNPYDIIKEIKGWRSYQVSSAIKRFIRLHEEQAIEKLIIINDVMVSGNNISSVDSYEARIQEQFLSWKEKTLSADGNLRYKNKNQLQENPYLSFDEEKGLCIILPEFFIEDEYCEAIRWVIKPEDREPLDLVYEVLCDSGRYHSLKKKIPVKFANSYSIKVYDADTVNRGLIREWQLNGATTQGYLLFDENGKKQSDKFIPSEGGFLLVNPVICTVSFNEDIYEEELYLPNGDDIDIYNITPLGTSAQVILKGEEAVYLIVKKTVDIQLAGGEYLFNEAQSGGIAPIYTKFPSFVINNVDSIKDMTVLLKNRDMDFKYTAYLEELSTPLEYLFSFEHTGIFNSNNTMYGRYSLRIYDSGIFKKSIEFSFVPNIPCDDSCMNLWPDQTGYIQTSGFRYKNPQNVRIDFAGKTTLINENVNGEIWKKVNTMEHGSFIYGNVKVALANSTFTIPFQKRVRNIEWNIWNEKEVDATFDKDRRISVDDYCTNSWWLSISLCNNVENSSQMSLCMFSSKEKLIQEENIKVNKKGKWQIDLDKFRTSIDNGRPPFKFVIKRKVSENNIQLINILEIYEPVLMNKIKYQFSEKQGPYLVWAPSGIDFQINNLVIKSLDDYEEEDVLIKEVRKIKLNSGERLEVFFLEKKLKSCLYSIEYAEESVFIFEQNKKLRLLSGNNLISPTPALHIRRLEVSKDKSDITRAILSAMTEEKSIEYLLRLIQQIYKSIKGEFSETNILHLFSLLLYASEELHDKKQQVILEILNIINSNVLQMKERKKMIKILLNIELTDEQLKKIVGYFDLEFAPIPSEVCTKDNIKRIAQINQLMALRMLMNIDKAPWIGDEILTYIGTDAMKEMIPIEANSNWFDSYGNFFSTDHRQSQLQVNIKEDVIGVSNTFYNMFNWAGRYEKPKLDYKKRPEDETVFFGDGFVNLLIHWYNYEYDKKKDYVELAKNDSNNIYKMLRGKPTDGKVNRKLLIKNSYLREVEGNGGFYPILKNSFNLGILLALMDLRLENFSPMEEEKMYKYLKNMKSSFANLLNRDIALAEIYLYFTEV